MATHYGRSQTAPHWPNTLNPAILYIKYHDEICNKTPLLVIHIIM